MTLISLHATRTPAEFLIQISYPNACLAVVRVRARMHSFTEKTMRASNGVIGVNIYLQACNWFTIILRDRETERILFAASVAKIIVYFSSFAERL